MRVAFCFGYSRSRQCDERKFVDLLFVFIIIVVAGYGGIDHGASGLDRCANDRTRNINSSADDSARRADRSADQARRQWQNQKQTYDRFNHDIPAGRRICPRDDASGKC